MYSKAVKYLGNLLLILHTDLGAAQKKLACANVDYRRQFGRRQRRCRPPSHRTPRAIVRCTTLKYEVVDDPERLKKCAGADNDTGTAIRTRTAVMSTRLSWTYKTIVEAFVADRNRSGERAGELWSRTDVIKYVYRHFVKAC